MYYTKEDVNYKKTEKYSKKVTTDLSNKFYGMLAKLGENPEREGLLKTPERAAKAMQFLTQGYEMDAAKILKSAMFSEDYNEMVLIKDIEVYSLCEHHVLPFFGHAHIGYIPKGKVIGLSKIPRIVNMFARRLQMQERLCDQITNALWELLEPEGVGCIIEGHHMCMMMRGVQSQGGLMLTSAVRGSFLEDEKVRSEFLRLVAPVHSGIE